MRKRHLLFVTYHNDHFDDGLSYAVELARTLGKDLSVLLVPENKGLMEKFTDMMAASAFAEAHEPDAAIQILNEGRITPRDVEEKNSLVQKRCRMAGIDAVLGSTDKELLPAIKESVGRSASIDMVLLGPTVTGEGRVTARELNRLVKTATIPVITIARHASAA